MEFTDFITIPHPPTTPPHLTPKHILELSIRVCLSHQWGCGTLLWEIRKKILISNTQCLCSMCSRRWGTCAPFSVAGLWFGLSDIQFLHYDGSWRLVVSCSSSLSKRENLVLRVVFKIRSYQQLLAGMLSDGKGRFSLSPAPYHPFPLVQASIELSSGIFCILVNTSSIYCSSLGDENTEQLSVIA